MNALITRSEVTRCVVKDLTNVFSFLEVETAARRVFLASPGTCEFDWNAAHEI